MERRTFFQSLIAGGATVKQRATSKNRREHHVDERIYHGPMEIPERVSQIVAEHPAIKRTTHRQLVSRYAEGGDTWIFRCQIPAHRLMVGEIVRTPEGKVRVHCWSAADPERCTSARQPAEIIAARFAAPAITERPTRPILPPMLNGAAWTDHDTIDPAWAERIVTEALRRK